MNDIIYYKYIFILNILIVCNNNVFIIYEYMIHEEILTGYSLESIPLCNIF